MTPRRRWGTLTDASAAMPAHRHRHPRCAAMTTSTGLSNPWCCPSMIYAIFLCDACHPLFHFSEPTIIFHRIRSISRCLDMIVWNLIVYSLKLQLAAICSYGLRWSCRKQDTIATLPEDFFSWNGTANCWIVARVRRSKRMRLRFELKQKRIYEIQLTNRQEFF